MKSCGGWRVLDDDAGLVSEGYGDEGEDEKEVVEEDKILSKVLKK